MKISQIRVLQSQGQHNFTITLSSTLTQFPITLSSTQTKYPPVFFNPAYKKTGLTFSCLPDERERVARVDNLHGVGGDIPYQPLRAKGPYIECE